MKPTHKQYNVLLCIECGDPLPDEAKLIIDELHFLNLVDKYCSPVAITWAGMHSLDWYEETTTIAERKQHEQ
jgi:hypothetical protein